MNTTLYLVYINLIYGSINIVPSELADLKGAKRFIVHHARADFST